MRNFLMKLFKKDQNGKNIKEYPYLGLGPTIHPKEFAPYLRMLEGGFRNNYTNIALSGNFGSGKTSVIKTFKEHQNKINKKRKRKNIIDVSLASFLIDKNETNSESEKLKYLSIEKSILQQLFYKVKGNRIVFSRFS